jgi:quercetin dioxygenase-like cupin family protein
MNDGAPKPVSTQSKGEESLGAKMNDGAPKRIVVTGLFDADAHDHRVWEPFRAGIEVSWIYRADNTASAALLRYEPGASVPEHVHDDLEHILVLSGEQSDANGTYPAGTCLIHGNGTRHAVHSRTGCIVLAVWAKPVRFV